MNILFFNALGVFAINKINPKKLLRSKWTAVKSINKEKHFLITEVDFDEDGGVILCLLEAIISHRTTDINWHDLKDTEQWLQGWK